jgi:hypothetical protein
VNHFHRNSSYTDEDHIRFVEGFKQHGDDWQKISEYIGTKSRHSVMKHRENLRKEIENDPSKSQNYDWQVVQ